MTFSDMPDSQQHMLVANAREYLFLRQQESRLKQVKSEINVAIDSYGEEEANGHRYVEFPAKSVDGLVGFRRQRRVRTTTDGDLAEKLLRRKGLWNEATSYVTVIDEQKVYALYAEGKLDDADLGAIYPQTVDYALVPVK